MVVYSHTTTARLRYVIHFLAGYFGISIKITSSREEYLQPASARINYSQEPIASDEIFIKPHSLLFEKGIRAVDPDMGLHLQNKIFFRTEGTLPFDLLAAIFYLLSRYEEYLPHEKDRFGRYAVQNALAYRENFLDTALVDRWLEDFRKLMQQRFPQLELRTKEFQWIPTYDIDIAWSYSNKGWNRNLGGGIKDALTGKWRQVTDRINVLAGKGKDPYDGYDWIRQLHAQYGLKAFFFFLVAAKTGKKDKNINPRHRQLQQLIRCTAQNSNVGLHPSWQSGDVPRLLPEEKARLETITGKKISISRQHYLRFTLPQTYRQLIAAGITDDFSMGYGTANGFRASTTTPFLWYDLEKEEPTSLRIHPFCFMDATAFYQQRLSASAAAASLDALLGEVRSVNGTMYTIWHNHLLGSDPACNGWKEMYAAFAKKAIT